MEDLDERPDLKAWAMVALVIRTIPQVQAAEQKRWLDRVLETLPKIDDPAFAVFLLGKVAMVLVELGDPAWRELTDRIEEQTAGQPRGRREVVAYRSVGLSAGTAGHYETAERLLAAALAGSASCESRRIAQELQAATAMLDYCRGAWQGLADRVEALIHELAEYAPPRADVEVVAGCLAVARGEHHLARQRLELIVQGLAERGGFDLLPIPVAALARLAAAGRVAGNGAADDAAISVPGLVDSLELAGPGPRVARALPALTEAMVATGRAYDAHRWVDRWHRRLGTLDAPLLPASLPHARGWLAAAGQQWRSAADQFLAAADRYVTLQCPYEAAQAREHAAVSLLAGGRRAEAATALAAALATYRQLGAAWDFDRATSTARRHGLPSPARHRRGPRGYGDQLSPREREVAELAVSGLTNKEIATRLFVSPETVKKHLRTVMRKRGARSRTALAHRLPEAHEGTGC